MDVGELVRITGGMQGGLIDQSTYGVVGHHEPTKFLLHGFRELAAQGQPLVYGEQCSYCAAEWIEDERAGVKRPVVDADVCTGCGICEAKCPVQPEAAMTVNRSGQTQ